VFVIVPSYPGTIIAKLLKDRLIESTETEGILVTLMKIVPVERSGIRSTPELSRGAKLSYLNCPSTRDGQPSIRVNASQLPVVV
jgi:hypothetical protein